MVNITQSHNGTGDNVAGDKVISGTIDAKENTSLPIWAQWVGWFFVLLAFAWGVYIYMHPH